MTVPDQGDDARAPQAFAISFSAPDARPKPSGRPITKQPFLRSECSACAPSRFPAAGAMTFPLQARVVWSPTHAHVVTDIVYMTSVKLASSDWHQSARGGPFTQRARAQRVAWTPKSPACPTGSSRMQITGV